MRGRYAPQEAHAAYGTNSHIFSRNVDCFQIRTITFTSFQVLEPDTVDYDKVIGDMTALPCIPVLLFFCNRSGSFHYFHGRIY